MNYTDQQIQEAYQKLEQLRKEAYEKIREMEKIADEFSLDFRFSVVRGMGGYYLGKGHEDLEFDEYDEPEDREKGKWCPSSYSC